MAKVLVMTDTVAGIPRNLAEEYRIAVVPAANIILMAITTLMGSP